MFFVHQWYSVVSRLIFGDSFSSVQIQSNRPDDIYLLEFTAKTGKDMSELRRNSKETQLMMADCSFYLSRQKGICFCVFLLNLQYY